MYNLFARWLFEKSNSPLMYLPFFLSPRPILSVMVREWVILTTRIQLKFRDWNNNINYTFCKGREKTFKIFSFERSCSFVDTDIFVCILIWKLQKNLNANLCTLQWSFRTVPVAVSNHSSDCNRLANGDYTRLTVIHTINVEHKQRNVLVILF